MSSPNGTAGNPYADIQPTGSTSVPSGYLPDGTYDYYNVGSMYDKSVFLGFKTSGNVTDAAGGYGKTAIPDHVSVGGGYDLQAVDAVTPVQFQQEFASWYVNSPADYANMQSELAAAGYYGSTKANPGLYSDGDVAAMNKAMSNYLRLVNPQNPNALTFSEFLDRAAKQGGVDGIGGGGGATRAPLQLTNTDTLNQANSTAAQNELGRGSTDTEQAAFAGKYHGEEQAAYNGGSQNAGDISAEATNFIDKNNNAEMQTHLQSGYAQKMLSMLGVG